MTERIYLDSDELQLSARAERCSKHARGYAIVLDRTIFHPQGGGQPSDAGLIDGHPVLQVILGNTCGSEKAWRTPAPERMFPIWDRSGQSRS